MENKTGQHPTVEQLLEQAEFELAVARQQLTGTQELLTQAMGEIARQEVLLAKLPCPIPAPIPAIIAKPAPIAEHPNIKASLVIPSISYSSLNYCKFIRLLLRQ